MCNLLEFPFLYSEISSLGKSLTNDSVNGADSARLDELADLDAQREISRPDGLHQEDVLGPGGLDEFLGLRRGNSEGLLAQDVLAGLQGQHDILEMVAVRGGDVDDVHVRVVDELMV